MRRLIFAIPLLFLTALYWKFIWLPAGHIPIHRKVDFFVYFYPMWDVISEMFRSGEVPLWNPYIYSGTPLLASPPTQVCYPPNLLHVILPSGYGWSVLLIAHSLWGILGTWKLSRSLGRSDAAGLFSGMAFACSLPMLLHMYGGHITVIYSAVWCPWIFASLEAIRQRVSMKHVCQLAACGACQFLTGYPQFMLISAGISAAYMLWFGVEWRHPLTRKLLTLVSGVLLAVGLALGLVAIQFLPAWEFFQHSYRGELTYQTATAFDLPPADVFTALVPGFLGDNENLPHWGFRIDKFAYYWETGLYCGASTILLACFACAHPRRREFFFWLLMAAALLLVSLGDATPIHRFCYDYVPGFTLFRSMAKTRLFFIFCMAMLAGQGMDVLLQQSGQRLQWGIYAMLALGLLWLAVSLLGFFLHESPQFWDDFYTWVRYSKFQRPTQPLEVKRVHLAAGNALNCASEHSAYSAGFWLAALGLVIWKRPRQQMPSLVAVGLLILLGIDLGMVDRKWVGTHSLEVLEQPVQEFDRLTNSAGVKIYRKAIANQLWSTNRLMYVRAYDAGGSEDLQLKRYIRCLQAFRDRRVLWHNYEVVSQGGSLDLMAVRWFAIREGAPHIAENAQLKMLAPRAIQDPDYLNIYENTDAPQRFSLLHVAKQVADLESAALSLEQINTRTTVILEATDAEMPSLAPVPEGEAETIEVIEDGVQHLTIDVDVQAPAVLLVRDNYYPGWEAEVDGKPVEILPANGCQRAVPVAPGKHRVTMDYRPATFRTGAAITVATLLLMGLLVGIPFYRSRRNGTDQPDTENSEGEKSDQAESP